MDTDDLSKESYQGILLEAEKLTHDLTLHYGVLSSECMDEAEYLDNAEELTREIMEVENWELDDLLWGNPPNRERLIYTCKRILENIKKVRSIPIEKRTYDF